MYDDSYYRQFNLNDMGGFMWYQLGNQIFGPPGGQFGPGPGPGPGFPGSGPGSGPFFPGGPGPGGPPTGGGGSQPPSGPPPSFTPQQPAVQTFAVDPGAIRRCLNRYTFVWTRNQGNFWFFPVFVGRRSIAGYRWIGFTWIYFGIDLNDIQSFQCF